MWLETHIWHAKRFHMARLYGYKLALHDNCKAMRPTLKALNKFCILHDESYHICWQLEADEKYLLENLSKICSSENGLTFSSIMYLNGQYEGSCVVYELNKYPMDAIGPVRFLWKPKIDENTTQRHLWIWIHPSIYDQIKTLFIKLFELKENANDSATEPPQSKKAKIDEKFKKFLIEPPKDLELENSQINVKCLKDRLIRFKLLGPYSTTILGNTLKPVCLDSINQEWSNNTHLIDYLNDNNLDKLKKQMNLWEQVRQICDPSELTPSLAVGLLVKDPRLILPKKKSFKTTQEQNTRNSQFTLNTETKRSLRESILSHSPIWNKNVIEHLNKNKLSIFEINKLRSKYLIPENEIHLGASESKVPILLIQNGSMSSLRTNKNGCMFNGWDIIIPQTWAMSFWQTLVYFGARAVGQQEIKYAYYESGNLSFPDEYLDTEAGKSEQSRIKNELLKEYQARPPSKRVNFVKTGFLNPFYCPLKIDDTQNGFILRNKRFLIELSQIFFGKTFDNRILDKLRVKYNHFEAIFNESFTIVRLESVEKGSLDTFSQLYMLNDSDLSHKSYSAIVSINQEDKFKQAIIKFNENKLKTEELNEESLINEDIFVKVQAYLNECSNRKLIGVICNGKFCSTNGQPAANALILTKYLFKTADRQHKNRQFKNLILYRAPNSSYLKLAKINEFFI
jgi:ribonuclease P/MRP protein subunit POP1